MPVLQVTKPKGEKFSSKYGGRNTPSPCSLAPHTTSCGKIFLTHKAMLLILTATKSKFLSIINIKDKQYSKELMMQILTVELMITLSRALCREWEESLRVKNGKARELVLIAKDYLDHNFDRGISVADAASFVYLSQGYFTRAFRDELGISPMGYLMRKRIEKSCELLENNEIKVSGVACQVGFSSPQRFNVAFRKQMGMTPMEYRRSKMKERR